MEWMWSHKKSMVAALAAIIMAVWAVLVVVPGDQKEDVIKSIGDKVGEAAEALPDDK